MRIKKFVWFYVYILLNSFEIKSTLSSREFLNKINRKTVCFWCLPEPAERVPPLRATCVKLSGITFTNKTPVAAQTGSDPNDDAFPNNPRVL